MGGMLLIKMGGWRRGLILPVWRMRWLPQIGDVSVMKEKHIASYLHYIVFSLPGMRRDACGISCFVYQNNFAGLGYHMP